MRRDIETRNKPNSKMPYGAKRLSDVIAEEQMRQRPRGKSKFSKELDRLNNPKLKKYSAVINDKDLISVTASNLVDALNQIARHCEAGETFKLDGVRYEVQGKLSKTRVKRISNPLNDEDDLALAKRVSKEWHGRNAKEVIEVEEVERYNDTAVVLGSLEELGILGNKLKQWQINFKTNRPMLTADLEKNNLEFVGGDQKLELKNVSDKRELPLGYCYSIVYETDKHHLEGSNGYPESYIHFFAEEFYKKNGYEVTEELFDGQMISDGIVERAIDGGWLPLIVYDCVNRKLKIVGGKYKIKDVGITD
jgi:hypothetical protein